MKRRFLAVVALVLILSAFGGTWTGQGQTMPPGTLPLEQIEYKVYLPVIMGGGE